MSPSASCTTTTRAPLVVGKKGKVTIRSILDQYGPGIHEKSKRIHKVWVNTCASTATARDFMKFLLAVRQGSGPIVALAVAFRFQDKINRTMPYDLEFIQYVVDTLKEQALQSLQH